MLTTSISMDLFLDQLTAIAKSVIVKRDERAEVFETVDTLKDSEKYITAIETGTDWNSYINFNYSVLVEAGFRKDKIEEIMKSGKNAIPHEMRDLVCRLQKEYTISHYKENNNYYRMLNGEPDIEDIENEKYVYIPKNDYGIPTDIPIHQLSDGYIEYYNSSGLREQIYAANPTKGYVLHQGIYKISYYKARTARNYDLLYLEKADNDSVTMEFIKQYNAARDYVIMGLYTKEDQRMYDHYDSFMGFVIMAMAIQKTIACVYQQGITRDYFDNDFIKHLFDAYNIPYIDTIDIPYQKLIAKRLNILLQKKSSDAVLFDITDLFDYNSVDIFRYYLVKDYKKDENGDPVIVYRKVVDENGDIHEVVDYDKTFDIYFQKVNIKSKDPAAEISDQANRVPYNSITGGDPYWLNDSSLINKIYDNNFNSILTKYLSIEISYDLAKMMYETTHLVRMIIDDQEDYKKIHINLPYASEPVSLFDTVLFLCALSAKKIGMAGNCPLKGYQIAQVYGFNFKEDIDLIRDQIIQDVESCTGEYKEVNLEILNYLNTLNATTLDGARKMFENIESLRIWLDTAMRYCTSPSQYRAYRKIYRATLVVEDVKELYTKADGTYASTFAELLGDRRPDLKDVLDATNAEITSAFDDETSSETETNFSINNKIDRILLELSKISEELKDIKYSNDKSAIVANIEKLINQFKSFTVDQTASSVLYLIKDPHITLLKVVDEFIKVSGDKRLKDELNILYGDILHQIIIFHKHKSKLELDENYWSEKIELLEDFIHLVSEIARLYKIDLNKDIPIVINDFINSVYGFGPIWKDLLILDEKGLLQSKEIIKQWLLLQPHELIILFLDKINEDKISYIDTVNSEQTINIFKALILAEKILMETKYQFQEFIKFDHVIKNIRDISILEDSLDIYDIMLNYVNGKIFTDLNIGYNLIPERYSKIYKELIIDDKMIGDKLLHLKKWLLIDDIEIRALSIDYINKLMSIKDKIYMEKRMEHRDILVLLYRVLAQKYINYEENLYTIDGVNKDKKSINKQELSLDNKELTQIDIKFIDEFILENKIWNVKELNINSLLETIDNIHKYYNYKIEGLMIIDDKMQIKMDMNYRDSYTFEESYWCDKNDSVNLLINTDDGINVEAISELKNSFNVSDSNTEFKTLVFENKLNLIQSYFKHETEKFNKHDMELTDSTLKDRTFIIKDQFSSTEQSSNLKVIDTDYNISNRPAHSVGLKETLQKIYKEV